MRGEKHSHVQTDIPLHITGFIGFVKKKGHVIELLQLLHFVKKKNGRKQT